MNDLKMEDLQKVFPHDVVIYFTCRFNRSGHSLINHAFRNCVGFIFCAYGLLILAGLATNTAFLARVFRSGFSSDKNYLFKYLSALCFCHVTCCLTIIPFGVLVQATYWNYGAFLCFTLPVMQDFMSHFHFLLILILAIERYREIVKRKDLPYHFPATFTLVITISAVISLPDVFFVKYYQSVVHDVPLEICVVDTKPMDEYTRAMFIFLYATPVLAISFLSIQVSAELRVRSEDIDFQMAERSSDSHRRRYFRAWISMSSESSRQPSRYTDPTDSLALTDTQISICNMEDLNAAREELAQKRATQKFLNIITASTAIAWLPLNIVSVIQFGLKDNHCDRFDQHAHLYTILVWLAYCPAFLTPLFGMGLLYCRVDFVKFFSVHYYRDRFTKFDNLFVNLSKSNTADSDTYMEQQPSTPFDANH